MSLVQITIVLYLINLICSSICSSLPLSTGIAQQFQVNNKSYIMLVLIQPYEEVVFKNDGGIQSNRVKRQSGAGKFSDSAKMSQTKVLQVWLQMFKNTIASSHVGGSHPMHPEAVKPVVQLFKQRIIDFFFPEVGESKVDSG